MWTFEYIVHECFFSFSVTTHNTIPSLFEMNFRERWGEPDPDNPFIGWENEDAYNRAKESGKYYSFNATYKQCMYGIVMFASHPDEFTSILNNMVKMKNGVLVCNDADTLEERLYG